MRRRRFRIVLFRRESITVIASAMVVAAVTLWGPRNAWSVESGWNAGVLITPSIARLAPQAQDLRTELAKVSARYDADPVDARIDRVWKLIPGLNGVRLDVVKTLRLAQGDSSGVQLYFNQIAPRVGIKDLVAQPIYRGNPAKRQIALMFNVAWGTEYVPQILRILRQTHVRSTFFLDGSWATKHPAVVRDIAADGMELGNHAFNHPMMSRLSRTAMISQISRTNRAIEQAVGFTPTLFAPPAGDFNSMVVRVAAGLQMSTVLWTLDTVDWKKPSPALIVARITKRAEPGALVLMHPTAQTVAALPKMISALQREGYDLVTVSHLLNPVRPVPKTLGQALRG